MTTPLDKRLYAQVKRDAKKKFKVWPSAYASGWLVNEYKRRGGRYSGKKKSAKKESGLTRWFNEKWINVCKLPKKVSCGRPKTSIGNWKKNYPYCRPSVRVTSKTPKTVRELSKEEITRRCKKKRASPFKRVSGRNINKYKKSRRSSRARR